MKPFEDASHACSFPLIIGHRGAASLAPENTIVSFKRAMTDGADGIEFDVRLAHDSVPVVIHDPTLLRTGLREGAIASLSSTELRKVNVGTWFNLRFPTLAREEYSSATIPTLAEVFELFRESSAMLYVEMKCVPAESHAIASSVAKLIREYEMAHRAVVESFTLAAIAELKRIAPEIRTAALFEPKLMPPPYMRRMMRLATECRSDELALHRLLATRRVTEEALRHGMKTVVWTVDSPAWLARARRYGIRAVITNNPAIMKGKSSG
ncbi:MAG TPA: glycerophosphodiester phosphodiesterase family protein [Pyrinomonadaceae bacterium]|nr:glycerophosphodiester phosphodiesterase family protein [Pyrinomonadaceae bacterium]